MLRNFSDVSYFPTLSLRVSEMRALEELPSKDKDALLPTILMAPWATSKTLEKGVARIKKAYGERPFILDVDRYYGIKRNGNPVQEEFQRLKSSEGGAKFWMEFVKSIPNAIPVLQAYNMPDSDLQSQLNAVLELGRGFVVRLEKPFAAGFNKLIFDLLQEGGYANYAFMFDTGWTKDMNSEALWFDHCLRTASEVNASIPAVLCSASFPKEFGDCSGITPIKIGMRDVYARLQREHNQQKVSYGDWASTRPRENRGGGGITVERIDYPTSSEWVIARNKEKDWSYLDAAKKVMASEYWNPEMKVWGSYEIEKTALGDPYGINYPAHNVAARVNIHLHQQTWFGDPVAMIDTDDEWVD